MKYRRGVELVLHYKCSSVLVDSADKIKRAGCVCQCCLGIENVIEPENLSGTSDITSHATRELFVKVFSLHLGFLALSLLPLLKKSIAVKYSKVGFCNDRFGDYYNVKNSCININT